MKKLNALDVIIEFYLKREQDNYYNLMQDEQINLLKFIILKINFFVYFTLIIKNILDLNI